MNTFSCDAILSWMIEIWMKNHLVGVNLRSPSISRATCYCTSPPRISSTNERKLRDDIHPIFSGSSPNFSEEWQQFLLKDRSSISALFHVKVVFPAQCVQEIFQLQMLFFPNYWHSSFLPNTEVSLLCTQDSAVPIDRWCFGSRRILAENC